MGLGGSKLQDELDASKRDLTAARVKLQALEAQHGVLQTEAQQTAERLRQRDAELAAEGQERERLLRAKDDELGKAIKQRQLAEELRRNDALLAKRVMCAQMKAGGRSPVGADFDAGSVVAGGAMAAQMVLAADDMVQLRQVCARPHLVISRGEPRGRTPLSPLRPPFPTAPPHISRTCCSWASGWSGLTRAAAACSGLRRSRCAASCATPSGPRTCATSRSPCAVPTLWLSVRCGCFYPYPCPCPKP